jgi:hypothetical protein
MEENTKWHALFLMKKGKLTKTSRFISDCCCYIGGTNVICLYVDKGNKAAYECIT